MNRYLIECINDCKNEFVVAYAPSMYDYAYELAVSIVDDEFIVTAEGYDYEYMTDEDVLKVLNSIDWDEYYNYNITPFEGTDGYVSLPPYLDSYEYFERYSKVNYMDYTVPENFEEGQNLCCPLFPGITYEEAIDQLYGFVKKNRIIGCVYDW